MFSGMSCVGTLIIVDVATCLACEECKSADLIMVGPNLFECEEHGANLITTKEVQAEFKPAKTDAVRDHLPSQRFLDRSQSKLEIFLAQARMYRILVDTEISEIDLDDTDLPLEIIGDALIVRHTAGRYNHNLNSFTPALKVKLKYFTP